MSRVSRALPHLSAEALKQKFRTAKNFWQQQKWLVIYNALVDGASKERGFGRVKPVYPALTRYGMPALWLSEDS